MKLKRLKHVRKVVSFYKHNYGFSSPLRVLIDGTFCKAALKFKVNISEQLPKYLDCELRLCTTACVKAECEALGPLLYGPLKVLQQFKVLNCGHDSSIPASKCLLTMVRKQNEGKFYIATQDQDLSDRIRSRHGIPLLFIAYNAINLEAPAEASRKRADRKVQHNIVPTDFHKDVLDRMKVETFGEQVHVPKKRRHKKVRGPNPLSCKKKKTKIGNSVKGTISHSTAPNSRKKKRRKRRKNEAVASS